VRAGGLPAAERLDPESQKRPPDFASARTEIGRIARVDELREDNEWVARERACREQKGQP
jgi:hypothetical protein